MNSQDRRPFVFWGTFIAVALAVKLSDDFTGWIGDGEGVLVVAVLAGLIAGLVGMLVCPRSSQIHQTQEL